MAYVKIIYQDSPSTATPLNAQNLNHMDDGIAENDRRLNELATAGVVNTFNGRRGVVVPESGDYTADMIPYDEENSVGDILGNATSEIDGITVANASGESFALVPTSEGNALATHIFGMSTQDGTPTPSSPVDIVSAKADFRSVGKNLIPYPYRFVHAYSNPYTTNDVTYTASSDGILTASGTANGGNANYYLTDWRDGDASLIKAGTYTLSGCPTGGNRDTYCLILYCFQVGTNGTEVSPTVHIYEEGNGITFTLTEDVWTRLYFRVVNGTTAPSAPIKPVLRLASVTDATYEPYKSADIVTDLTLRAIEVTSSDNYNLVRDGKYYIADTVDWNEVEGYQITRRVGTQIGGTVTWYTDRTTTKQIIVTLDNKASSRKFMSNMFSVGWAYTNGLGYIGDSRLAIVLYIDDNSITSVATAQTWMDAKNPVLYYPLDTPTKTSLTSEQAQSLLSLKTYDVSTSINAQASPEPTIDLEYAKTQTTALALSGHNEALIAQELEGLYGAKNLIYYPYNSTSGSNRGIDFTVNDDGSVSFSGTPNASGAPYYRLPAKGNMFLKAGTYIISADGSQYGCISVTFFDDAQENTKYSGTSSGLIVGDSAVLVYTTQSGESPTTTNPCGYSKQFTIGSDAYLSIQARTVNNSVTRQISGTYKPMLRLATNTSNTYQPYAMSNYELTKKIRELETAIIELGGN